MGKRVFMFPGQGSQYIGMGKEICEKYPVAKEVFDKASEITGLDVAAMCFEENDKINITEYTQICMLTVEAALFAVLKEKGITYDLTAGLSLGEYGALIASGAISMEDAFAIVRKRGIYMQNAVPEGGGMSAVIGLDASVIEDACKEVMDNKDMYDKGDSSLPFTVSVANYNNPKQSVITGRKDAVLAAGIFAIQSFNLPVPFGSSGHLLGAALVAIIFCSPYAAIIVLSVVLILQALFFGDGGITALGANIVNMAIVGGFVGYYGFTGLKDKIGLYPSIFIAAWAGCFIAALVAAVEMALSGTFPLDLGLFYMGGYHAMIGFIEAIITVVIIKGIDSVRPDLLSWNRG